MKRFKVKDRIKSWKELMDRTSKVVTVPSFPSDETEVLFDVNKDPFDCSDLIILPPAEAVKKELKEFIEEWKELDSRVIQSSSSRKRPWNDQEAEETQSSTEVQHHTSYHRMLPDFFDYESKRMPSMNGNHSSERKQVVSLENPSETLDYESELWKIFHKVPLMKDMEYDAEQSCYHLWNLKKEMDQGCIEYSRLDAHALSRLRKKDRHHLPRHAFERTKHSYNEINGAVIRIEAWRRHPRRGQGSDENRCEMEFSSHQTLLDVHNAIVQMGDDVLFDKGRCLHGKNQSDWDQQSSSPGYFFIEDTFYTASENDVDYVTPIKTWLDFDVRKGRKSCNVKSRRRWLGIPDDIELKQIEMKDILLEDLDLRLAVRYLHVYNGDCETSIFFTDVGMRKANENIKTDEYPLIHDIFTTSASSKIYQPLTCHACNHSPGQVITIEDEMTDGGPTLFCFLCYKKLHYVDDGKKLRYNNFKVVPISVLHNLKTLSVGHSLPDCAFSILK
jgi:hypothetical protein